MSWNVSSHLPLAAVVSEMGRQRGGGPADFAAKGLAGHVGVSTNGLTPLVIWAFTSPVLRQDELTFPSQGSWNNWRNRGLRMEKVGGFHCSHLTSWALPRRRVQKKGVACSSSLIGDMGGYKTGGRTHSCHHPLSVGLCLCVSSMSVHFPW